MAPVGVIGVTAATHEEVTVEWKIKHFFKRLKEVFYHPPDSDVGWLLPDGQPRLPHEMNSDSFVFSGSTWHLSLFFHRRVDLGIQVRFGRLDCCSGFYLHRDKASAPETVRCTVGIKGEVESERGAEFKFEKNDRHGWSEFISRDELRRITLYPKETTRRNVITIEPYPDPSKLDLTIICVLKLKVLEGEHELRNSLRSLLESGENSDIVIKVEGREFPAHRAILSARCPFFKAMFSHDMAERKSGVVTISDCHPDTFRDFLKYIYTGSTAPISPKNVEGLYVASDKYGMDTLKEMCIQYIMRYLTVNHFCKFFAMAVKHNEPKLIKFGTDFFCNNSIAIIQTADWETFLKENFKVGNDLLVKHLSASIKNKRLSKK